MDVSFISNLGDSATIALAKMSEEGKITSDILGNIGKEYSSDVITKELDTLHEELWSGESTMEEYNKKMEDLNEEFGNTVTSINDARDSLRSYLDLMDSVKGKSLEEISPQGNIQSYLKKIEINGGEYAFKKVEDAIISPNGNIITTSPQDYLIATKNPQNLGGNESIVISPTYYVTVSDKKEFETMLERNNKNLVNEFRRG